MRADAPLAVLFLRAEKIGHESRGRGIGLATGGVQPDQRVAGRKRPSRHAVSLFQTVAAIAEVRLSSSACRGFINTIMQGRTYGEGSGGVAGAH